MSKTWLIVGGFAAFLVGLGVLSARSVQAGTAPPPTPQPVPPAPIPPTPRPVIVRQGSLTSTTSPAVVRVLQTQLQQLGYAITRIDGVPSAELGQATLAFENDYGLSHFTPNLELLLAVDTRYGQVFDPLGRH